MTSSSGRMLHFSLTLSLPRRYMKTFLSGFQMSLKYLPFKVWWYKSTALYVQVLDHRLDKASKTVSSVIHNSCNEIGFRSLFIINHIIWIDGMGLLRGRFLLLVSWNICVTSPGLLWRALLSNFQGSAFCPSRRQFLTFLVNWKRSKFKRCILYCNITSFLQHTGLWKEAKVKVIGKQWPRKLKTRTELLIFSFRCSFLYVLHSSEHWISAA